MKVRGLEFRENRIILILGDCDDSVCTSIPQDLDFMSSDEGLDDDRHLRLQKGLNF